MTIIPRKFKRWERQVRGYFLEIKFVHTLISWFGLYKFSMTQSDRFKQINRMYLLTHFDETYRNELVASIKKDLESKVLLEKRVPVIINQESFSCYPENTLGRHYYEFLIRNKIPPLIYRENHFKRADEYTYIILRILCIHDIYHVLLEQDIDFLGEGFVAAFTIAQLPAYVPPSVHLSAGFLNLAVFKTHKLDEDMETLFKGWVTGLKTRQLFNINWNDFWHEDIDRVRETLGIDLNSLMQQIDTLLEQPKE